MVRALRVLLSYIKRANGNKFLEHIIIFFYTFFFLSCELHKLPKINYPNTLYRILWVYICHIFSYGAKSASHIIVLVEHVVLCQKSEYLIEIEWLCCMQGVRTICVSLPFFFLMSWEYITFLYGSLRDMFR